MVAENVHAAAALDALLSLDHDRKTEASAWASEHFGSRSDAFDRDRWQAAADFGVLGLRVPPAFGGKGCSTVDALLVFEGLGHGALDTGMVFALAAQVFAMQTALLESGSDEQKQLWLPRMCAGQAIGCFAMTERHAGSDAAAITMTATATPSGYRLDGTKTWVTLGPQADVVIVFAKTDESRGAWGITAFVVPLDSPGVVRGPTIPKAGLESCPFNELRFDGVEVDHDAVLGAVGSGMRVFTSAVEAERAFLYASQIGTMQRMIDTAVERARRRSQFGKPIGAFQAVSHRIADMKLRHEAARLLVYKAGALHDLGRSVTLAAALAKLQASESAVESALDLVRIHGAEGYTVEGGIESEVRDALGGLSYSGTSDIQRNIVARLLQTDRPLL